MIIFTGMKNLQSEQQEQNLYFDELDLSEIKDLIEIVKGNIFKALGN